MDAVSYTHLEVYKRQTPGSPGASPPQPELRDAGGKRRGPEPRSARPPPGALTACSGPAPGLSLLAPARLAPARLAPAPLAPARLARSPDPGCVLSGGAATPAAPSPVRPASARPAPPGPRARQSAGRLPAFGSAGPQEAALLPPWARDCEPGSLVLPPGEAHAPRVSYHGAPSGSRANVPAPRLTGSQLPLWSPHNHLSVTRASAGSSALPCLL
ncbi:hypothetical protein NN561_012637 [Cricetulus griseus]